MFFLQLTLTAINGYEYLASHSAYCEEKAAKNDKILSKMHFFVLHYSFIKATEERINKDISSIMSLDLY